MTPKKLKTNKLFYGKWPYKISTVVTGGNYIKTKGIDYTKRLCLSPVGQLGYKRNVNKDKLLEYINILEQFSNDQLKIRAEYDTVNIYTQDKNLYERLQKAFAKFITSITEPVNETELQALLSNNKIIICEEFPKGIYRYKVTFKTEIPLAVRENLHKWLLNYGKDKIFIPIETSKKFSTMRRLWGDCYLYVSDSNMLMMLTLAAQGYIRRTDEYVLRSSINTNV